MNKLKSENRNFYEELKTNKESLSKELKVIASDIIRIYERLNPFFFLTEEIILGSEKVPSLLDKFLELEFAQIDLNQDYIPSEFELSINEKLNVDDLELKLTGKIDRVDINSINSTFKVIDYKTGEPPSKKDYEDKLSFQLPLYLILVKNYLSERFQGFQIDDAEFIKLSPKKRDGLKRISFRNDILKSSDIEFELKSTLKAIAELINHIRKGKFNLTTIERFESRICRKCGYQNICRIDFIKKEATNSEPISEQ